MTKDAPGILWTQALNVGGTDTPVFNSSNALRSTYKDFTYSRNAISYASISNAVFTENREGVTVVTATYKPTNRKYVFAAIVEKQPCR